MTQANPTSPQVLQTYTLLQIAAEAFLGETRPEHPAAAPGSGTTVPLLTAQDLQDGNDHSSRMTTAQAAN